MIPVAVAVFFLLVVVGCFYYIFRGLSSYDSNPVIGSILATGINAIVCAFFVMWFLNGGITEVSVVENLTYCVDYSTMSASDISNITPVLAAKQYVLDANGAGMYTIKAINAPSVSSTMLTNFTVAYSTHDIIYSQYQERSLSYFFLLLTVINLALFGWFVFSAGWPAVRHFIQGSPPPAGENLG